MKESARASTGRGAGTAAPKRPPGFRGFRYWPHPASRSAHWLGSASDCNDCNAPLKPSYKSWSAMWAQLTDSRLDAARWRLNKKPTSADRRQTNKRLVCRSQDRPLRCDRIACAPQEHMLDVDVDSQGTESLSWKPLPAVVAVQGLQGRLPRQGSQQQGTGAGSGG